MTISHAMLCYAMQSYAILCYNLIETAYTYTHVRCVSYSQSTCSVYVSVGLYEALPSGTERSDVCGIYTCTTLRHGLRAEG